MEQTRKLYRSANDKMWFRWRGTIIGLEGEIDCEYRAVQLLAVRSFRWRGRPPKGPQQFLGIVTVNARLRKVIGVGIWFGCHKRVLKRTIKTPICPK